MKLLQYLLLVFTIVSCHSEVSYNAKNFGLIMPDTSSSYGKSLDTWRHEACKKFELPLIHKGVDSFEFRFWVSEYSLKPSYVYVLKYDDDRWRKDHRYLFSGIIEDSSQYEVTDRLMIDGTKFFSSDGGSLYFPIKEFYIESIADQQEITGFKDSINSGRYYTIELATKHYYKLIRYHNPESYPSEQNNKNISELAEFLRENF